MNPSEELLAQWIDGTLSASDAHVVEEWLAANPDQRRELEEMREAGTMVGVTHPVSDDIPAAEFFMHQLDRRLDDADRSASDDGAPAAGGATITKLPWMKLVVPPMVAAVVAVVAAILTIRAQHRVDGKVAGGEVRQVERIEVAEVYTPHESVKAHTYYESDADAEVVILDGLPDVDASLMISGFGRDAHDRKMWAASKEESDGSEMTGTNDAADQPH